MTISEYSLTSIFEETRSNFLEWGQVENLYYKSLLRSARSIPGGANIIGDLIERIRTIRESVGLDVDHILAVGFQNVDDGTGKNLQVGLGAPIDYDIWYLFYAGNIILNSKPTEYSDEEWIEEVVSNRMYNFITEIDSSRILRPLKQPKQAEAKTFSISSGGTAQGFSGMVPSESISSDVTTDWQYAIKEARFEVMVKPTGGSVFTAVNDPKMWNIIDEPHWPSKSGSGDSSVSPPSPMYGVKTPDDDAYVGYIAFPVGPVGVMWRISLASESSLSGNGVRNVYPADYESAVVEGKQLLPPFDLQRDKAPGEPLVSKGYLVEDDSVVELTAEPFDTIDNPAMHGWMRYWIRKDNQVFWPGELVVLLCRPWPLHCWWFQESAPLIYSGNWIETEFYTSGVVKCVLEMWTDPDEDPPSIGKTDESGYYDSTEWDFTAGAKLYVVWVKNEEIIVSSSDFLEYEVGERVGLLKCVRDGNETTHTSSVGAVTAISGTSDKFSWESLKWFRIEKKDSRDKDMFTLEWVIVPVAFFPGVSGVGG